MRCGRNHAEGSATCSQVSVFAAAACRAVVVAADGIVGYDTVVDEATLGRVGFRPEIWD